MEAFRQVYHDHPKTVLFSTAAALRILLALTFPTLPDLLTARVEISTPVNSFKRCMCTVPHGLKWLSCCTGAESAQYRRVYFYTSEGLTHMTEESFTRLAP